MSLENCCVSHSLVDARLPLVSHKEVEKGLDKVLGLDLSLEYHYIMRKIESNYPKIYSVLIDIGLNNIF